jgi:hypothetical protein
LITNAGDFLKPLDRSIRNAFDDEQDTLKPIASLIGSRRHMKRPRVFRLVLKKTVSFAR